MSQVNLDSLMEYAQAFYMTAIVKAFGNDGVKCVRTLFPSIRRIYGYLEPELIQKTLHVFVTVDPADRPLPADTAKEIKDCSEFSSLAYNKDCVIQVLENGRFLVWQETTTNEDTLSNSAIVYTFTGGQEMITVTANKSVMPKVVTHAASDFASPTYADLERALQEYSQNLAKHCTCRLLQPIWKNDKRTYFNAKPESVMRNSLWQYLHSKFSTSAEVRPEQNVDDSHPVDIKITWLFNNRRALIEIKWLGKSVGDNGNVTTWSESRAREGAKQLSDYMDANKQNSPGLITMGTLVVFDGRRNGVTATPAAISNEDARHFADKDISYDPEYHKTRNDMLAPHRFFLEPILV